MTYLVLVLTTLFVILTAPQSIANGFFVNELFKTDEGTTVLFYLDSILFSFHSLNFFALLLSNKQFSREVKFLIAKYKLIKKIAPTTEQTLSKHQKATEMKRDQSHTQEHSSIGKNRDEISAAKNKIPIQRPNV